MIPSAAKGTGSDASVTGQSPAVFACPHHGQPEVLRLRADFLRAAQARRQGTPGFLLQARNRADGSALMRVGFTCSKKLGNAVARNRAKRRLRAIAQAILPHEGLPGWDYVLVGRPGATATREFEMLLQDLRTALGQVHAERRPK
jgi:ribonuclease P protein component